MDVLTPEQRRRNMQAIKSKETKAEVIFRKALWARGHRYRKNNKKVFGNPDITFKKCKVAVFVDGEYFHGFNWQTEKHRIKSNRDFWWTKIESNMARDRLVTRTLRKQGWTILRFWAKEILNKLVSCVRKVEKSLNKLCQPNIQTLKRSSKLTSVKKKPKVRLT
jgi:DNA mismatch endonuclease (patch repair protein)